MEDVAARGGLDLGMPPRDPRVAEDADLGALVEPEPASRGREQVDPALLSAAEDLDPGPSQGLLDQGQAEPQPAAEDDDPDRLPQVVPVADRDAQPLEQEAADEPAEPPADQAEDQPVARAIGDPLPQPDPQPEHGPGERPAQEPAPEAPDDDLARDQPDRPAHRRGRGARASPRRASFEPRRRRGAAHRH